MLPKSVIACLAASAFATGALMPTGASAAKGGPSPGTLELATLRCKRRRYARTVYVQLCARRPLSSCRWPARWRQCKRRLEQFVPEGWRGAARVRGPPADQPTTASSLTISPAMS